MISILYLSVSYPLPILLQSFIYPFSVFSYDNRNRFKQVLFFKKIPSYIWMWCCWKTRMCILASFFFLLSFSFPNQNFSSWLCRLSANSNWLLLRILKVSRYGMVVFTCIWSSFFLRILGTFRTLSNQTQCLNFTCFF